MINVDKMMLIQLEVTNACPYRCSHCSRLIGHHKKPFFMTLEEVEKGLQSLEGYNGHIGIMGGEPLLHWQFEEICKLMQAYVPVKARRELWTAGYKWDNHKDIINETFYPELVAYNEHEEYQPCWHQPLQIAIQEVIKDEDLMWKIISNCWVQQRWSASITPKGAYFCEVVAARAHLFGTPEGLPVEKGWWRRPLSDYMYQIKELCPQCSACLPMEIQPNDKQEWDDVSQGMFNRLIEIESPKCAKNKCRIFDIEGLREYYKGHTFEPNDDYLTRGGFKDFPEWTPWHYRDTKKHSPRKEKENGRSTKDLTNTQNSL